VTDRVSGSKIANAFDTMPTNSTAVDSFDDY